MGSVVEPIVEFATDVLTLGESKKARKTAEREQEQIAARQTEQAAALKKEKDEQSRRRRSREQVLAGAQGGLGATLFAGEVGVQRRRTLGA